MTEVAVEIGEVVLDGLASEPDSGSRLGALTESALGQLIERRGLPPGVELANRASIAVSLADLPPHADDSRIASALAMALYRALESME